MTNIKTVSESFEHIIQELEKADNSIKNGNIVTDSEIRDYFSKKYGIDKEQVSNIGIYRDLDIKE